MVVSGQFVQVCTNTQRDLSFVVIPNRNPVLLTFVLVGIDKQGSIVMLREQRISQSDSSILMLGAGIKNVKNKVVEPLLIF